MSPVASLILAVAPAAQDGAVRIEYRPEPGNGVVMELRTEHDLLLGSLSRQREGAPPIPFRSAGSLSTSMYAAWRDDWSDAGSVMPTVRRSYRNVELKGTSSYTPRGATTIGESSRFGSHFEGRTVLFTWVPEEAGYGRRYEHVDGPEESLALVREEADARSALPAGPVRPGDRWEVGPEVVRSLLTPGGNLDLVATKTAQTARTMKLGVGGSLADTLAGEVYGEAVIVFRETRPLEGDGPEVAVLSVQNLQLQSVADQTVRYEEMLDDVDRKEPAILEGVVLDYSVKAHGEILWNLAEGRLHSYSLEGEQLASVVMTKTFAELDQTYQMTETATYNGTLELSVACTPVE